MKVSREQVQHHRNRIVAAAARLFREHGFDGVSVAQIMKEAGLTHGAFYGHFDSKEALISAALAHPPAGRKQATERAADYADRYLSMRHRNDRGRGCPIAGLGSEASRASPEVRATLTRTIRGEIERLAEASPGATPAQRRRAGIAAYSAMVGAMMLARIADEEALSEEILSATRESIDLG
jgi:TetR/AcrR family transcriptional regulator, transcriptional repressor for nem operon